jgi:hypothetical protein
MAVRSTMHHAGATALSELLHFPAPAPEQRTLPCACGHRAHYRELRTKPVLTAVGKVAVSRPYYLCPHCHAGQFPADAELDIENADFSPGVRRMQAMVGAEYFEKHTERMRYPEFRAQHLFVGSGVIEAGCKTVIGSRLKQSGMFWTVRGANAIIALRCCHLNNRFEDYWEARRPAA